MNSKKLRENVISYSFIVPFLIFFIAFVLVPLGYVFYLSVQKGSFLDPSFTFCGMRNFEKVLTSKDFINSFKNSVLYILIEVPTCQIIALTFAVLLKKKTRINGVFETVYFLPMLISMVAASVAIAYFLSQRGPINYLLSMLGIPAVNWLGTSLCARLSVMFLELWKGGNFFIFVYMAAIRALPMDCSEAARIDGANCLQEFFRITLPMLRNTVILCVVMNTIWQFQVFESVYMLTGGGPLKSTETVVYSVYQYSFMFGKIGVGSAASVLFLMIILTVSLIEMFLLREKKEVYTA